MKTFVARVRVGEQLYGNGTGRSKKQAEQGAAETAYARSRPPPRAVDAAARDRRLTRARAPRGRGRPRRPGPPRHRRHHRPPSRCCTRARCAVTPAAPTGFVAALIGHRSRPSAAAASTSGSPLDYGDALLGHLGMSGQMLLQQPGAPDERHLRVRFALAHRRRPAPRDALRRPADVRRPRSSPTGGAELPTEIAHIGRDPLDPEFDEDDVRAPRASPYVRDQAAAARPDPRLGHRQHLRRRGAVAGPGCTATGRATGSPGPGARDLLGHVRDVMGEALAQGGTSFDALYVNVNGESGYFDRSLHAYGRRASRASAAGRRSGGSRS